MPSDSPEFLPGRYDKYSPDLFIPLISFLAHCLLVTLLLQTVTSSYLNVLSINLLLCTIFWALETAIVKLSFCLYSINLRFFEIFTFIGYKFVGLTLIDIIDASIENRLITNFIMLYLSLMMFLFMVLFLYYLLSSRYYQGIKLRMRMLLLL